MSGQVPAVRTICQALEDLSDLNDKQVKVRGVWGIGDTGQTLFASPACALPTIRDGWQWPDVIEVYPAGGRESISDVIAKYHQLRKQHPDSEIMVTLTGRLGTRDHFDVRTLPDGFEWPVAFKYYVAVLAYRRADNLEVVPLRPGEREYLLELGRKSYAVRAEPGPK
jgi:hypothetical protein